MPSYTLPTKELPKSDKPLTCEFILPPEMEFPNSKEFPNRKRLRKFLRRKGYSIKQFTVKDNKRNTDLIVTIKGYTPVSAS